MIYKSLSIEEVQAVCNELKGRLPGTAKIFYVIKSFLEGLLPGKEVIVDTWPEWTSIIVRSCDDEAVSPFFRHSYMCHARSSSSLKYFIQRPGVINWRKAASFTGIPQDVAPVIHTMCQKHLGTLSTVEPRFMYAWTRQDMPPEPSIPDGLKLGTLTEDDAVTLRKDWEGYRYKENLEGYFRTVIQHYDSSCLRNESGELVAYACMQFNGSMAMLYVKPEHRTKNYFEIVLADLARTRLKKGEVAYGFIPTNDSHLVDQMRAMDFVWVPRGDMVWVHYEPLKINMSKSNGIPIPVLSNQSSHHNNNNEQSRSLDLVCSSMAQFTENMDVCRSVELKHSMENNSSHKQEHLMVNPGVSDTSNWVGLD